MTARIDLNQIGPIKLGIVTDEPLTATEILSRSKGFNNDFCSSLGNISIAIADDDYINRSIKETNQEIDKREVEIFVLEKKLLTLNGLKRQMDKKSGIYQRDTSSTNGAG
jgi:hypothetical protein